MRKIKQKFSENETLIGLSHFAKITGLPLRLIRKWIEDEKIPTYSMRNGYRLISFVEATEFVRRWRNRNFQKDTAKLLKKYDTN